MSKARIYGPALIALIVVAYKLHQAYPHPIQSHRSHNQEIQKHDVLTLMDELHLVQSELRGFVSHIHH
jgi:hypothetical protein